MRSIGEPFILLFTFLKLWYFNWSEQKKVRKLFYLNNSFFAKIDTALQKEYRWKNPYTISKNFLQQCKHANIHAYGETPLSVLYKALIFCGASNKDCFLDLGCGRGRTVFLASAFFKCKSIGIDFIPYFIEKAQDKASTMPSPPIFLLQDMQSTDLSAATILYFYELCLEEDLFLTMVNKLKTLKEGTFILTTSFSLQEYSSDFSIFSTQEAHYPWGKTTLYINRVTKKHLTYI